MNKRIISIVILMSLIIGMIPLSSIQTHAATKRKQYIYLISGINLKVTRNGNDVTTDSLGDVSGGWPWKLRSATGTTFYNLNTVVYDKSWPDGARFKRTGKIYPAQSSFFKSPYLVFSGEPNQSTLPKSLSQAISDKAGSKPVVYPNNVENLNPNTGKFSYDASLPSTILPDKKTTVLCVVTAIEYISEQDLPDPGGGGGGGDTDPWEPEPEPEPEPIIPSSAGLSIDLNIPTILQVNYKNMTGNLSAIASVKDSSSYGTDGASLKNSSISLVGMGTSENSGLVSGLASTSITSSLSSIGAWGTWQKTGYDVDGWVDASLNLTDGSPRTATRHLNWQFPVLFENNAPSTGWSLQTNNINNGSVPNGFYYVDTPATIRVSFSDPENDILRTFMAVGLKSDMDNGLAQLIYINETSGETYQVSNGFFELSNVVKNINGYTATIVFKKPGTYSYSTQVIDAKSNTYLSRDAEANGTFLVRSAPEAPTAIITSPTYAFENEPFKVTQGSTDPNGVDDIIYYRWTNTSDVTAEVDPDEAADPDFKPITNVSNSWPGNGSASGKNGGTLVFPTGSAHHSFRIGLDIRDATNLTDATKQVIKVVSNVPVASLTSDVDANSLKENRKIVISAANSLAPSTSPILWNEAVWKVEAVSGGGIANIFEDKTQQNGNKQRVLQFDKPGVYKVTVTLANNFSKQNPTHEDIGASTVSTLITVVEDRAPLSNVVVTSGKPNFDTNPVSHVVSFKVSSYSDDGDNIVAPRAYNWVLYEDYNDDGVYSASEVIPQNRLTYNAEKTEVSLTTNYQLGRHNKIKAVVTTTEEFAEAYMSQFLASDGSYIRKTTVDTVETVNWIPKPSIQPPSELDPNTPYEDTDIDGDTIMDGKFVKAYTDDTFSVGLNILDEFPATVRVTWELQKKDHSGAFNKNTGSGGSWISSSNVSHTLGHDGGSIKITSPGIYLLKAIVKDDNGDTNECSVMVRIYTLPIAVLETNPTYLIKDGQDWYTKENIRFDLRSNPTIVDDEWGKAWHTMDWSKDNWDVKPLQGQSISEIHFMNPDYTARYNDVDPSDETKFSGRNSPLGFGQVVDRPIDIIVVPGLYGQPTENDSYQLTSTERQQLYSVTESLGKKLQDLDKRYNVKVYNAWAAQDSYDLFRTPEIYGYFDGFSNTGDDEKNMFTLSYKTEGLDGGNGKTTVVADIAKMNAENCKFGVLQALSGYESSHPEMSGKDFYGTMKVYCNNTLISDHSTPETWTSIGDKDIATLEKLEDGTWKVVGDNNTSVICSDSMEITIEFSGDKNWIGLVARGWAGIYNDEYKWVTHPKTLEETLKSVRFRANATKIVIYATNYYQNNPEFNYDTDVKTNEACQSLKDYLLANQMHLISIAPATLALPMTEMYKQLTASGTTYGEWHPLSSDTTTYITNDIYNYVLGITTLTDNTQYRSCSFTDPGLFEITYWGTNYGGKVTKPVTYTIEVEEDLPPIISGEIADKFLRDPNDLYQGKYRATIALTGPYADRIGRDVLTITSPDGDYIDYTTVKVTYDSNNNKLFTDLSDTVWNLTESSGNQLTGLFYVLQKINP